MNLLDKIGDYYKKADNFILERHIEVANWANYNFGKSNYELSTYSVFSPAPLTFATYAYNAATSNISSLPRALFCLLLSVGAAYAYSKTNRELERKEQISLENLAKDYTVSSVKNRAKFFGPCYFFAASLSIPDYISIVASGAPFGLRLSQLSMFALLFGCGAAEYFTRVDHIPKKKGRIPEAVKNAATAILRKPVANPSGA